MRFFEMPTMLANSLNFILRSPNKSSQKFAMFSGVTTYCCLPELNGLFVLVRLQRNSANKYMTVEYADPNLRENLSLPLLCINGVCSLLSCNVLSNYEIIILNVMMKLVTCVSWHSKNVGTADRRNRTTVSPKKFR